MSSKNKTSSLPSPHTANPVSVSQHSVLGTYGAGVTDSPYFVHGFMDELRIRNWLGSIGISLLPCLVPAYTYAVRRNTKSFVPSPLVHHGRVSGSDSIMVMGVIISATTLSQCAHRERNKKGKQMASTVMAHDERIHD